MGIHHIKNGKVVDYAKKKLKSESELEDFLEKNPQVLDKDIFIIGRQVPTIKKTRLDLMGLDSEGNVVIIELKKGLSEREVVSQILEYAVWADKLQYEDLNRIAKEKHLKNFPNLMKKYEKEFNEIPEPFNRKQKLYIVAEKIEGKIEEVCRYLKIRAIDIKCVELNFHESDGHQLTHTNVVVGNEETIYQELEEESKSESLTWNDKLELSTPTNRENVENIISKIEQTFECEGRIHNRWFYFHTNKNNRHFATIIFGRNSSRICFRIDPESFNENDERIRVVNGWFFPRDSERRIHILPENESFILQCLKHAYDITLEMS